MRQLSCRLREALVALTFRYPALSKSKFSGLRSYKRGKKRENQTFKEVNQIEVEPDKRVDAVAG